MKNMLTKYIIASAILSANLLFANPIFQDEVWPEFENAKTEFESLEPKLSADLFDNPLIIHSSGIVSKIDGNVVEVKPRGTDAFGKTQIKLAKILDNKNTNLKIGAWISFDASEWKDDFLIINPESVLVKANLAVEF